jgi:SAM-dependent methyltransferase
MLDARKEREKAFHDQEYAEEVRWQIVDKYYSIIEGRARFWEDFLRTRCAGKRVLEYGCGQGKYTPRLAEFGADVTAIDLSETAMENARASARAARVQVEFKAMDAEALDFPDRTFDLICGNAILHHLDLDRSFAEVARTLKADGVAIFMEPLGHNPLINLKRRMTPTLRTPDEHPLKMLDFDLARKYFQSVDLHAFHLLSLAAVRLRRSPRFPQLVATLDRLDQTIFRWLPFTMRYAWYAVAVMGEPRPGAATALSRTGPGD